MIISTSSYNIQVNTEAHEFVEAALYEKLGAVSSDLVSVDVMLDLIHAHRRCDTRAIIRAYLTDGTEVLSRATDDNMYAAVLAAAGKSAADIEAQLSRQLNRASASAAIQQYRGGSYQLHNA